MYTKHEEFAGKYGLSARSFSPSESVLIPKLTDWYVIPQEVVNICRHARATTASSQPMRNFMMRGPAGTGKTEGAKAIAAGMGLPYVHITCSSGTEIFDLLGQMLPEVSTVAQECKTSGELPSFDDIRFDPPTAYEKLCGVYDEAATEDKVYENLVMDIDEPDADVLTKRVMGITGCGELSVVHKMAETVKNIAERCRETMIIDGCCGVRELIFWVQSYMICKDVLEGLSTRCLLRYQTIPKTARRFWSPV